MKFDVGIIGLGYVGLTLATALAKTGLTVLGVEKRQEIVDLTNRGTPHFKENGLNEQLQAVVKSKNLVSVSEFAPDTSCDVYILTVGTPLNIDGTPRLDMIQAATKQVAENMQNGAAVILRSTVMVGTTRDVVKPILDATGIDYELSMCPERTLEGNAMHELFNLPQIIGSSSENGAKLAKHTFSRLTKTLIEVTSYEAAEIIKLVDNTSRDISFAFANEVARICENFSVDAMEVINGGKLGYTRTNVALPGLVGGPCLEKDPHIFNFSARNTGIDMEITNAARQVNERQPYETVLKIQNEASKRNFSSKIKIAILGMAFKGVPETNDLRGSMSFKVLDAVRKHFDQAEVIVFDFVADRSELESHRQDYSVADSVKDAALDASIIIIANNHHNFKNLNLTEIIELMQPDGFIYDYWNHFYSTQKLIDENKYFALGNMRGIK